MKVMKRDNTYEDFNPENIIRVVKAAGLNDNDSKIVADHVNVWIQKLGKESITSLEIRDKVQEELNKINENVANLYSWYQTTKES